MKIQQNSEKRIPILFAILTIAAYGLLLPFTGFYWDDWPFAWIARFQGPAEFFPAFYGVRPFLSPIFFVTTSLIPPVPLYWQLFALVIRFLSGLSAWFALSQTWSQHKRPALIASILFLLFPGYSQHWVAFTHINQEWIPLIFYLLSFGFTARALRTSDKFRRFTIYALLLLAAGVFPTEYFIGLEPLRFFFIWVIVSEEWHTGRDRLLQTLRLWVPYLLVWIGYLAWMTYFYTIGNYDSYDVVVAQTPPTLLQILGTALEALWKGGFYSWGQILVLIAKAFATPTSLLTVALIAVTFAFLRWVGTKHKLTGESPKSFAPTAFLAGMAGILLGRVPSFAAGLPLTLQSSNDRFMISMMLGGSLFIVGLTELLIQNRRLKDYLFAFLIALAVGQQFFNANIFRRDWAKQQEFYQQLAWRIPAMKPNTVLITDVLPLDYETDLSLTAPINWMYAPNYTQGNLPHAIIFTEIRLGGTLPTLERDRNIDVGMRSIYFHGSTSQAIVIYMSPNGCLRVLDPARGDQITYAQLPPRLVDAIPLSDPTNIILDHAETVRLPFLKEPGHSWCSFFTKAELAYQKQDWNQVIELIDEAIGLGYQPMDPFEWLGYIEAQARLGHIDTAWEVANHAQASNGGIRRGVCEVWKRVQAEGQVRSDSSKSLEQVLADFQCNK